MTPAELVRVMVGAEVEVGAPDTVPTTEDAVPVVVRLKAFAPLVIVALWPTAGAPVNIPVAVAAVGALPVKVTVSTVTVEVPLALLVVTVPAPLAATPPIPTAQSFLRAILRFLGGFLQMMTGCRSGTSAPETSSLGVLVAEMPVFSGGFAPPLRLMCCRVKRGSCTILSHCS